MFPLVFDQDVSEQIYLAAKDNMLESLLTLCIKWAGNYDAINGYRDMVS